MTYDALPFDALIKKATALGDDLEKELDRLRFVLRDLEHAEQHEMWEAARKRGDQWFTLLLELSRHAKYVLDVIDSQDIGNQSEAWSTGVKRMRNTLEDAKALYDA